MLLNNHGKIIKSIKIVDINLCYYCLYCFSIYMKKETVVVIGAGIAGLLAAKELAASFNVVILEALSRFGGRIDTVTNNGFSVPVEAQNLFVAGPEILLNC